MLKYMKDGLEKLATEGSSVIPILEANGWELVSETVTIEEPVSKAKKPKKQEPETEGYIE